MSWVRWVALLCAAAVPALQRQIDARLGSHRATEEILYLWSGDDVRRLFPGFESLMADVYWLRTVQYFGGQRAFGHDKKFEVLEPLIDITVTLDPRFEIAYRYGATFLSEPPPIGAGRPEAGVRILERGARANPRSWILMQNLGFFLYFHLGEPVRAARIMLDASRIPGAPFWFANMAADFMAKGGERETARKLWRRLYEQAEEGQLRRNAKAHLDYLDALDTIDRLRGLSEEFHRREGRYPASLVELVRARLLAAVPADPAGVPFEYDSQTGAASISRMSRLWRSIIPPRTREPKP